MMNEADIWSFLSTPSTPPVVPLATALLGSIGGFLVSRYTLSKVDKENIEHKKRELGIRHQQDRDKKFSDFCNAIRKTASLTSKPTLDDFQLLSNAGDLYFSELRSIADSILTDRIDERSRKSFVSDLVEAVEKNIPIYYEKLQNIAEELGVPYEGRFDRRHYESIVEVAEKYAGPEFMPAAAGTPSLPG